LTTPSPYLAFPFAGHEEGTVRPVGSDPPKKLIARSVLTATLPPRPAPPVLPPGAPPGFPPLALVPPVVAPPGAPAPPLAPDAVLPPAGVPAGDPLPLAEPAVAPVPVPAPPLGTPPDTGAPDDDVAGAGTAEGGGAGVEAPRAKSHVHTAVPIAPLGGFMGPRSPSKGNVLDPVARVLVVPVSIPGNAHC
jgi:hypothetical protein